MCKRSAQIIPQAARDIGTGLVVMSPHLGDPAQHNNCALLSP